MGGCDIKTARKAVNLLGEREYIFIDKGPKGMPSIFEVNRIKIVAEIARIKARNQNRYAEWGKNDTPTKIGSTTTSPNRPLPDVVDPPYQESYDTPTTSGSQSEVSSEPLSEQNQSSLSKISGKTEKRMVGATSASPPLRGEVSTSSSQEEKRALVVPEEEPKFHTEIRTEKVEEAITIAEPEPDERSRIFNEKLDKMTARGESKQKRKAYLEEKRSKALRRRRERLARQEEDAFAEFERKAADEFRLMDEGRA